MTDTRDDAALRRFVERLEKLEAVAHPPVALFDLLGAAAEDLRAGTENKQLALAWTAIIAACQRAGATSALPEPGAAGEGQWPDAVSDGLTLECHDCGQVPRFDYRVTAEFWRKHVPGAERTGVVCLPCLDRRCSGEGLADALEEIQWIGTGYTVVFRPTFRHEYGQRTEREG